jgi:hypothetical protein
MPNRHKEEAEIQLCPNSTQALKGVGWVKSDAPRPLTPGKETWQPFLAKRGTYFRALVIKIADPAFAVWQQRWYC